MMIIVSGLLLGHPIYSRCPVIIEIWTQSVTFREESAADGSSWFPVSSTSSPLLVLRSAAKTP